MGSPRLPVEPSAARRRQPVPLLTPPPEVTAPFSARDIVLGSWSGRLFLIATFFKVLFAIWRRLAAVPGPVQLLSSLATIALIVAVGHLVWGLFVRVRRQLLWRVRRKLILSYIFIGVVPALLLVGFGLIVVGVLSMNISSYFFKDGYDEIIKNTGLLADAAAADIGRPSANPREALERLITNNGSLNYPGLSLLFIPASGDSTRFVTAGRWDHARPPTNLPAWVSKPQGFTGTIDMPVQESPGRHELVVRAVRRSRLGIVLVDVPIDAEMISRLQDSTGIKAGTITVSDGANNLRGSATTSSGENETPSLFGRSLAFFDSTDWETGAVRRVTVAMTYRVGELYRRLALAQNVIFSGFPLSQLILYVLIIVAGLFVVIQIVALIMGMALARSITSSIHELFIGTERVQQGDFTHRISIETKDQLGELADSFNEMTGSIENLLQTAAEKKRLEEELRIARQIQMSLLPRGPLDVPGLGVTALCVPAREVGGDYYDLFPLPGDRLGVHDRRRRRQGHVSGALHGGAEGHRAVAQPDLSVAAAAADRSEPDHLGESRQPKLHHDDVCGHRSRRLDDDVRPRGPYAAALHAGAGVPDKASADSDAERHGARASGSTARKRSSASCSRKSACASTRATSSSFTRTASPRR